MLIKKAKADFAVTQTLVHIKTSNKTIFFRSKLPDICSSPVNIHCCLIVNFFKNLNYGFIA